MTDREKLRSIIRQAVDIHLHIGPEIIPRKYTVKELVATERGKLAGCVLKNHFYPTTALFTKDDTKDLQLYGGIVLNNAVGGLNPEAVYATALVSNRPIVVWFPTINSEQFLRASKYELAPEWLKGKKIPLRLAKDVKSVIVTQNGKLTASAKRVVNAIADIDAVLATGHISWQESMAVVKYALEKGVKRIVITHPIYQRIAMPISRQKELAKKGCYIEQCFSMYSIDKIPIKKIAQQINAVGANSVILSSDVGQAFSPAPSQSLYEFANLLFEQGISLDELKIMLVSNPKKLLSSL
jgi:hypothetical protein